MPERYYNPFQGMEVLVPTEWREDFTRYCQTRLEEGRRSPIEQCPFPRMVDLWLLGVCVAVRLGLSPKHLSERDSYKIIEGTIFSSDPWRVDALMMLGIGYTGQIEVIEKPREIMNLANGLAAAGIPNVLRLLKEGESEPIWNLSDSIEGMIRKLAGQRSEGTASAPPRHS